MNNDEFLLGLMHAGTLKLSPDEEFNVWHPSWKRWITKRARDRGDGRLRYSFYHPGRKANITIGRNRLLLLWKERREINGVADHIDLDRTNDTLENIQEMSREESDRQGFLLQQVRLVGDWFAEQSRLEGITA